MGRFKPVPRRQRIAAVQQQPEHREMLRKAAEAVKTEAERHSPIGETEDYIHRFYVVLPAGVRATSARVGNRDPFAHLVEAGSKNNPPYAPLRRGVIAAGFRFADDRGEQQ